MKIGTTYRVTGWLACTSFALACSSTSPTAPNDGGGGSKPDSGGVPDAALDSSTTNDGASSAPYSVSGSVSGLLGSGLVLINQLNGDIVSLVAGSTSFQFPADIPSGTGYNIQVQTQPTDPSQACTVAGASSSGNTGGNVTNLAVNCITNHFTVGGTVTGLGTGLTVTLQNGAETLPVSANGSFSFVTTEADQAAYSASVTGQPTAQFCAVTGATGNVNGQAVTSIAVTCTTLVNCKATLGAIPTATTGYYMINPTGSAAIPAYCDMVTAPGGWTLVYDQLINGTTSTSTGYLDGGASSNWLSANVNYPDGGQYSIISLLSVVATSAPPYTLRIDWPLNFNVTDAGVLSADSGVPASVRWSQVNNPINDAGVSGLVDGSVVESPTGQTSGCAPNVFSGLILSNTPTSSYLAGDLHANGCFWWSIGEIAANWQGTSLATGQPIYGIPAFNPYAVSRARLWVQ